MPSQVVPVPVAHSLSLPVHEVVERGCADQLMLARYARLPESWLGSFFFNSPSKECSGL